MPHINELIAASKKAEEQSKTEPYISIKLAGHDYVAAFKNKDKVPGDKRPDFKGDGVAVWIKSYIPKNNND